jgi:predicted chitinase
MSWFDQAREQLSKLQATLYSLLAKVEAMFSESPPDAVVEPCPYEFAYSLSSSTTESNKNLPVEEPEITCTELTVGLLQKVYGTGNEKNLEIIVAELKKAISGGMLNTSSQFINFIGQTKIEVGNMDLSEGLNYSITALKNKQSGGVKYFTNDQAETYGRVSVWDLITNDKIKAVREKANDAYAHQDKIGQILYGGEAGGKDFRGRGLLQLTHDYNYIAFNTWHKGKYEENIDFVTNPKRVAEPVYAVRSAIWVWYEHYNRGNSANHVKNLDPGQTIREDQSKNISITINGGGIVPEKINERWGHVQSVNGIEEFHNICGFKENEYNEVIDV